jgi:hypothetical protein
MSCCATDEQIAAYVADQAAPPKPAPDAMRDGNPERRCAHGKLFTESCPECGYVHPCGCVAPVPLPDGAGVATLNQIAAKAREWAAHYAEASDGRNTFILFAEWVESLSPSGAVAAEPTDVLQEEMMDCYQFGKVDYATPPVRGDRETIARIIDPELFEKYDLEFASGRSAQNGRNWADVCYGKKRDATLAKADAILSLPVQPGAGERENFARLSASEVACYRWPEDTVEHRAMRAAFMDGAAHTVTMSPDIDGMVSGPYKYEKDLHACFRVVHPDERRLVACVYATAGEDQAEADAELFARALCQAPHSSSEGER